KGRTSARLAWPAGLDYGMITKPGRIRDRLVPKRKFRPGPHTDSPRVCLGTWRGWEDMCHGSYRTVVRISRMAARGPAGGISRAGTCAPRVRAARFRRDRHARGGARGTSAQQGRDLQGDLPAAPAAGRDRWRGRRRPGPALRPDRSLRALRPGERRTVELPVQALPDPEGLAR